MLRLRAMASTLVVMTCIAVHHAVADDDLPDRRFFVYRDADSDENHGWWTMYMPDSKTHEGADEMLDISFVHEDDPNTGETCVRVNLKKWVKPYWAGIAAVCEPDFQGTEPTEEAFDLRRMKRLVFYARGEQGGEMIQVQAAILGKEPHGDSSRKPAKTKWIRLRKGWKKYEVDVGRIDLRRVVSPFCFVIDKGHNRGDSFTFYLDDIYFDEKRVSK